jgi:RNA polymerase sigma factor (sigma-70 family)
LPKALARRRGDAEQDVLRLYFDDIGKRTLLTKSDEIELAQAVEAGMAARARLDEHADELSPAERRSLRAAVLAGEQATHTFVEANLRLVVSIAKRYQAANLPLPDLIQEGNLGLMHAVEKFDWRKGFKFSTYATWWIRQAITRGIANTARTIRLPVHASEEAMRLERVRSELASGFGRQPTHAELADALEITEERLNDVLRFRRTPASLSDVIGDSLDLELGDLIADDTAVSPPDAAVRSLLGREVSSMLSALGDREREIVRLRYGLDRGEARTLEEVGAHFHLTRERIRQIETKALTKLRHPSFRNASSRELLED